MEVKRPNLNKYLSEKKNEKIETKDSSDLLNNKYTIVKSTKNPKVKSTFKIHDDSDIININSYKEEQGI